MSLSQNDPHIRKVTTTLEKCTSDEASEARKALVRVFVVSMAVLWCAGCTGYERFSTVLQDRGAATCVCYRGNAVNYLQVEGHSVIGGGADPVTVLEMLKHCKESCRL